MYVDTTFKICMWDLIQQLVRTILEITNAEREKFSDAELAMDDFSRSDTDEVWRYYRIYYGESMYFEVWAKNKLQ